jgi:hypothetical protein
MGAPYIYIYMTLVTEGLNNSQIPKLLNTVNGKSKGNKATGWVTWREWRIECPKISSLKNW